MENIAMRQYFGQFEKYINRKPNKLVKECIKKENK